MDSMEPTQPDVATARATMRSPCLPQVISSSNPNKRKSSSIVWDHFENFIDEEGRTKARCIYCSKEYMADSKIYGTSNLKNHTLICPEYLFNELHDGQDPLSKDVEEVNLVRRTFTNVVGRKVLAEMIILDELPFKFVENQGFRRFCNVFQPNFNIPSRFTVAKDVSRIYFEEKDKLRNALRGHRLCLTTDSWTSTQNFNYMCLTCHFIDDDWKLHKRILNFCIVDNHKGKTIGKMVESCLK